MLKYKVLVLGAEGMLGRTLYRYLGTSKNINCIGSVKNASDNFLSFDALKISRWDRLLKNTVKFDFVINCIAILKSYPDKRKCSDKDYLSINTKLPLFLEKRSLTDKFRLIHISTDSVFSKESSSCDEASPTHPSDIYDISKLLGEVTGNNSLTIRTSIIGYDPQHKKGLIEKILNSRGSIKGYINQKWSGATTLQTAKFIKWIIEKNGYNKVICKTHLFHYAPLGPTNKYDLVKLICMINGINPKVLKKTSGNKVTRFLATKYNDLLPSYLNDNNIVHALRDLKTFEER